MMQSPNFPPPTVRSSNFELLRIFCMLSIVAVHYVWHGGSAASGSNIAAAYFLGNFAQIGVACFVLIGAWFLIDKEFSITRIFIQTNHILFIKHCFITFHYWHGIIYRHHQKCNAYHL